MGETLGWSIDQLMELAGLSVSSVVSVAYALPKYKRILVVAGPGSQSFFPSFFLSFVLSLLMRDMKEQRRLQRGK